MTYKALRPQPLEQAWICFENIETNDPRLHAPCCESRLGLYAKLCLKRLRQSWEYEKPPVDAPATEYKASPPVGLLPIELMQESEELEPAAVEKN